MQIYRFEIMTLDTTEAVDVMTQLFRIMKQVRGCVKVSFKGSSIREQMQNKRIEDHLDAIEKLQNIQRDHIIKLKKELTPHED